MARIFTLLWLLVSLYTNAQTISGTATTTKSVCFNDGTITVQPTGGTGPYTLTIISGPTYTNYTYPVVLPQGTYTFINVPKGTFTIEIKDLANATGTITATVQGTYVFPSFTVTLPTFGDTLAAKAVNGIRPYQYSISSVSSSSGFSPFQSDSVFRKLCNGVYWIRLRDSCGNIFTNSVTLDTRLTFRGVCIDFDAGTATIDKIYGAPPFTFRVTHTSKPFAPPVVSNSLPINFQPNDSITLTVSDSCGRSATGQYEDPYLFFNIKCPFDGSVAIKANQNALYPLQVTCLNCPSALNFTLNTRNDIYNYQGNLQPNTFYQFKVTDVCGNERIYSCYTKGILKYIVNHLACNSVQIDMVDDNGTIVIPDSIVVISVADTNKRFSSKNGYFNKLPQVSPDRYNQYHIQGYFQGSCIAPLQLRAFQIPYEIRFNRMIAMDSTCNPVMHFLSLPSMPDFNDLHYVIIGSDTFKEIPPTPNDKINFYGLPMDFIGYLTTDSGCRLRVNSSVAQTDYLFSTVKCVSGKKIIFEGRKFLPESYGIGFASSEGSVNHWAHIEFYDNAGNFLMDTSYMFDFTDPPLTPTHEINIRDTGFLTYKVYIEAINVNDPYRPYNYDSICPLDSGVLYVTDRNYPFPLSSNLYRCPGDPPVNFSIYGGAIPYRVQVPGVDTFVLTANTAEFPVQTPGQYTIIVYDDCGVSRSITFSIIDTCTNCVKAGTFYTSQTSHCSGDTIRLLNNYLGNALSAKWYLNGSLYSNVGDTIFTPTQSGTYNFEVKLASDTCTDSASISYTISNPLQLNLGNDTGYCTEFTQVLIGASPNTIWSTSQIAMQITVDTGGLYWAMDSNVCGSVADTIFINTGGLLLSLGRDTAVCVGNSIVLSTGISGASYNWSTGDTTPSITIQYQGAVNNTISCNVTKAGCQGNDTITITFTLPPDPIDLGADFTLCYDTATTLRLPRNRYVKWSNNSVSDSLLVSASGMYWASDSNKCGTVGDTINLVFTSPPSFLLAAERTVICSDFADSILLTATLSNQTESAQFIWNNGTIDSATNLSTIYALTPGLVYVFVSKDGCFSTDSITLTSNECLIDTCGNKIAIPNAFSPNNDGNNDTYMIVSRCPLKGFSMSIYNRWGEKVFYGSDSNSGWDGTYNNNQQPMDTYFATVCINSSTEKQECYVKAVSLVR